MFAHTIQGRLLRADDFAVRRGGEEIAVVLPGLDASHALAPAETMLPAVRGLAVRHVRSVHVCATSSAGEAACADRWIRWLGWDSGPSAVCRQAQMGRMPRRCTAFARNRAIGSCPGARHSRR